MDAKTLSEVMGGTLSLSEYERLLPGYENAMRAAGITNTNRAAMFAAQLGHESVGLRYMEEIATGDAYEGRRDLGNIYAGDGRRFKGSGPIQLTGRSNFRSFTQWANSQGHTTIDFESNPHLVREEPKWGFLAASWYWVVARPQINTLSDNRDLNGVTRAINGGLNGIDDRKTRYHRALAMGNRILPSGNSNPSSGSSKPAIYHPMRGEKYTTSSGYGNRWGTFHAGLDFAATLGTPIYSPTDGVVIQGKDRSPGSVTGFGNWIWIDAQNSVGKDFIFGHMRHGDIMVKRGDRVKAGQLIARVGSEGQSTGPHLHFEVWGSPGRTGGKHEDPKPWLDKHVNNGITNNEGELTMSEADRIIKELKSWIDIRLTGPVGSDIKDIRQQLTGGRNRGEYPGWEQLDDKSVVDALAEIMTRTRRIEAEVQTVLDQLVGWKRDENGSPLFTGWEQGGGRSLYDLTSAIAAESGVDSTFDTKRLDKGEEDDASSNSKK